MPKSRNASQLSADPVRSVRLVVELGPPLGQAHPIHNAVTVDLTGQFAGAKLEEVVRAARAFAAPASEARAEARPASPPPQPPAVKPPKSKIEAELEPIDAPDLQPVRLKNEMVLGRSRLCDISIQHAKISRRHFRVAPNGAGFVIEDLGSANQTWVNGQPVDVPRPLEDGDVISAGDVSLRYKVIRPNGARQS